MKIKPIFIASFTLTIILLGCSVSSSTSEQRAARLDKMESLIESGNYEFTLRSASPSGGKTIQITSFYSMKAVDGKYQVYLPYFGRAYSAGYGNMLISSEKRQSISYYGIAGELKN